MDIQYYGSNCLVLSRKGARLVVDDDLSALGGKSITKPDDVLLLTSPEIKVAGSPKLIIEGPGEYEVSGLSIMGIAARAHMDAVGTKNATMYKILSDDTNYLITGHIYPDLTDEQLEKIGTVDVMFVPVGGNGYTLDAVGALQLVKKIEPKVVIPTHYAEDGLHYPVPQQTLDDALKNLGMEPKETTSRYRFKPAEATDVTQFVILSHS